MPKFVVKPLGAVLQQAGLVSAAQIEIALKEQAQSHLRLGEVLALHGWIKIETVEFFVFKWSVSLKRPKQRLGEYLKQAALLNEAQIQAVLSEQKQTKQKFGEIAVNKGWLTRRTRDFFIRLQASSPKKRLTTERLIRSWHSADDRQFKEICDRLLHSQQCNPFWVLELYRQILQQGAVAADYSPEQQELVLSGLVVEHQGMLKIAKPMYASVFNEKWVENEQNQLRPYRQIQLRLETKAESPYKILAEILLWTNRQPWLAQKLCQMVCQSQHYIVSGEEAKRIEQLVQNSIVKNWQHGVAADHLFTVRDHLLENSACSPTHLLLRYLQIWQKGQVPADGSLEQATLLDSGLVVEQQNTLKIANPIYRAVFDQSWAIHEMTNFLPAKEVPKPAALQQAVTASAQTPRSWLEKAMWVFIGAAIAGVLATIDFISQQQRPDPASRSTVETVQPSPQLVIPSQEASPGAALNAPADISADLETGAVDNIPVFTIGTTQEDVLRALGEPDWRKNGYWANSRAWMYKDAVADRVDLGYLFDISTQKLRQTEIAFAPSTDLDIIQKTLRALLEDDSSDFTQRGLEQVYQRRIKQYPFQVGTLEGIIQRNEKDEIYIGIWDADFH